MGYFYIQNVDTGLVLDVQCENRSASASIIMYGYKGSANQLWSYRNNMIYSKMNGMVLDVSPQGYLINFPCHGGSNQKWYFEGEFLRSGNGKYLDVTQGNRSSGATLTTYSLHRGPNQRFRAVPV